MIENIMNVNIALPYSIWIVHMQKTTFNLSLCHVIALVLEMFTWNSWDVIIIYRWRYETEAAHACGASAPQPLACTFFIGIVEAVNSTKLTFIFYGKNVCRLVECQQEKWKKKPQT